MQDYYELLDLSQQDDRQTIEKQLLDQNKLYRRRSNHKDPKVRNEATDYLKIIGEAMTKFRSDEERATYDKELEEHQKKTKFQEPLIDIDFYDFLELPINVSSEEIQFRIEEMERTLSEISVTDDELARRRQILNDARIVLLEPVNREKYDTQIATKLEFERKRQKEKAMPLLIGNIEVHDWLALEQALLANPDQGLYLLKDGEIEAWVRWSLGQRQRANWVKGVGVRANQSHTPFMEYEELIRLVNANRPLILYERGGGPKNGKSVTVNQVTEVPRLADDNWALFVMHIDYVLDWIAQNETSDIMSNYWSSSQDAIPDIQLERLIHLIDPEIAPPGIRIEGVNDNQIDFGTLSKWEDSTLEVEIVQEGRGFLYGSLSSNADWITLNQNTFAGSRTKIHIGLDKAKLQSGNSNSGTIVINAVDGRVAPVRLEVRVEQRTTWQSMKNIFKRN